MFSYSEDGDPVSRVLSFTCLVSWQATAHWLVHLASRPVTVALGSDVIISDSRDHWNKISFCDHKTSLMACNTCGYVRLMFC